MSRQSIGRVSNQEAQFSPDDGVVFDYNYDSNRQGHYEILLSNAELDDILRYGVARLLSGRNLEDYCAEIRLDSPDLPLFIGPKAVDVQSEKFKSNNSYYHSLGMKLGLATMSHVFDQRGTLSVARSHSSGAWVLTGATIVHQS